jgi:hypothetical protein
MSKYFTTSNNEPVKFLFNKKGYYQAINFNDLTFFREEKLLYGRVDREFKPIYAYSGNDFRFKTFSRKIQITRNLTALNFVVDAFNDLAQQFAKCAENGKIDSEHPYLSNLRVYKAYEDPKASYTRYLKGYSRSFRAKYNDTENFEQFEERIKKSLVVMPANSPLTFPAFIKNQRTSINVSGLAVEIADVNASNDEAKMELFVNSRNWQFYLNAARSFGFMVDLEVPWRLVADIGSSVMQEYASAYGFTSTDQILGAYFLDASYQNFLDYPRTQYTMYNNVRPRIIQYTEECDSGKTFLRTKSPKDYKTFENFKETFGSDYFLRSYCESRVLEEEIQLTQNEIDILIDDTLELAKTSTTPSALRAFEKIINKPFDYLGSLSYNIYRQNTEAEITGAPVQRQTTTTTGY